MIIPFLLSMAAATAVSTDSLAARVEARIAEVPGARVSVVYRELDGSDSLVLRGDSLYHAASTMKVPVLIEVFRRIDAGALSPEQPVLLVNQFGSLVDGSPFSVDAGDDSDSLMYRRVGQRVPVRELVEHMITRSSNLATNAVIALVGAERVTATIRSLGASRMVVLRGVEDGKAFDQGLNNLATASDLATLLGAIETGKAASAAGCDSMRAILLRQEFHGEIPAGLPPGIRVAHKNGWITGVTHDAAIVYPPGRRPFVLVVMTAGIPQRPVAQALIADIARMVYAHASSSRS